MFSLAIPRAAYVSAALALLIAVVIWLRWDAVQDERARNKLDAANGRVETLTDTKERRNDVEILSDDDLRRQLIERLSGNNRSSGPL